MTNAAHDDMSDGGGLGLSDEEMRALGYRAVDLVIEHLKQLDHRPVTRGAHRPELEARLAEPLPRAAMPPAAVLDAVERDVLSAVMHLDHPRFFAFVPGPSNFVSVIGDLIASGFNVFAGTWLEASGPAELELVTIEWLREICGLAPSAGGLMVSGGSQANLTALALARYARLGGPNPDAVVYVSDQTHSSVTRALSTLGFTPDQIQVLPSDDDYRLPSAALAEAVDADLADGRRPFCVVATAGSTNTGAIDPLPALAELCRKRNLWLHIDGAYGAPAALSSRARHALAGLERADSLALDPHKWLFQPYEIGCLLVAEPQLLWDCFHILPEYLDDAKPGRQEINFCDYGLQLTRRFNALKLWMSLKTFGADALENSIDRGIELAEHAEQMLRSSPRWQVVTPAQLGVITFRFVPDGADWTTAELDNFQGRIAEHAITDGFAMVATTTLKGRRVLRLCTINPRTTHQDLSRTLAMLEGFGTQQQAQTPHRTRAPNDDSPPTHRPT